MVRGPGAWSNVRRTRKVRTRTGASGTGPIRGSSHRWRCLGGHRELEARASPGVGRPSSLRSVVYKPVMESDTRELDALSPAHPRRAAPRPHAPRLRPGRPDRRVGQARGERRSPRAGKEALKASASGCGDRSETTGNHPSRRVRKALVGPRCVVIAAGRRAPQNGLIIRCSRPRNPGVFFELPEPGSTPSLDPIDGTRIVGGRGRDRGVELRDLRDLRDLELWRYTAISSQASTSSARTNTNSGDSKSRLR